MVTVVDGRKREVIVSGDVVSVEKNYAGVIKLILCTGYSVVLSEADVKLITKVAKKND
jgi:hypothetical protein